MKLNSIWHTHLILKIELLCSNHINKNIGLFIPIMLTDNDIDVIGLRLKENLTIKL